MVYFVIDSTFLKKVEIFILKVAFRYNRPIRNACGFISRRFVCLVKGWSSLYKQVVDIYDIQNQ